MITYFQSTGRLVENGQEAGRGYSGNGVGLNNPDMEAVKCVGPIPRGKYRLGPWCNSTLHGPCCTHLTPVGHDAHGRSGFMIHGDNKCCNHSASQGCIILGHDIRAQIKANGETTLIVMR